MTRKDYQMLATAIGTSFAMAADKDGERGRTFVYDNVYTPLVCALAADNENFNQSRFSYACAVAEGKAARKPDWIYNDKIADGENGAPMTSR